MKTCLVAFFNHFSSKTSGPQKEILTLLGLRQTGKSTLAFQLISDLLKKGIHPNKIFYFTFDDLSFRQELAASQAEFLKIYHYQPYHVFQEHPQ